MDLDMYKRDGTKFANHGSYDPMLVCHPVCRINTPIFCVSIYKYVTPSALVVTDYCRWPLPVLRVIY